jgi:thiamine pyrophosphokinase
MDADPDARTVVVVAGGNPIDPSILVELPEHDLVIAADSGLDHAQQLGIAVDHLVGDLDSVSSSGLAGAEAAGVTIDRHPIDKDQTDLELALDAAVAAGATRIVVVGGHGGRLDLALANLLVLASPRYAGVSIDAFIGRARLHVVGGGGGPTEIAGRAGDVVTLVPVNGTARGVTTEHLRYPLHHEDLPAGTTRGCSNELLGSTARVELAEGTLLCVLPREPR